MPGDSLTSSIGREQLASTSEAKRFWLQRRKRSFLSTSQTSRGDYDHESIFQNQVYFDVITDLCFVRPRGGPIEEQQICLFGGKASTVMQRSKYVWLSFNPMFRRREKNCECGFVNSRHTECQKQRSLLRESWNDGPMEEHRQRHRFRRRPRPCVPV